MRFQDTSHFKSVCGYTVNNTWYPRVTQILTIKSKTGLEYFFREMDSYSSMEEVKKISATEGALVHSTIEGLIKDRAAKVPPEIQPALEAFERIRNERGIIFYPDFIERLVWSPRHRYAGTVDALGMVGGKFGVIDIKTSTGFYPEYNLQTAAYVSALQEIEMKKTLGLSRDIETRWILRVDQQKICKNCGAMLREKGGRKKIRPARNGQSLVTNNQLPVISDQPCPDDGHEWGEMRGEAEIREFPYVYRDIKAFIAAKTLWEWENDYWLKQIGYL